MKMTSIPLAASALMFLASMAAAQEAQCTVFEGKEGPGKGKHVVLVSGDEEYRSEEGLAQLGKILSAQHGFKCTVLYAIDPKDGIITPTIITNIPGLETLKTADLMIIATRFRNLPDDQMKHIDDYLKTGKPVIGLRTATHGFNIPKGKTYSHYSYNYKGDMKEWEQGFGRLVLGETWINHHGVHNKESCRGLIAPDARDHPIARGIKDGAIWCPSDVYTVRLPLPGDSKPIIMGQVLVGMKEDDKPLENDPKKKNDPMMPIAWTKTYQVPGGQKGIVFTTTMGAAIDLANESIRKLVVNGVYWCVGLEEQIPQGGCKADVVGEFKPTYFGFGKHKPGLKPADYAK